MKKNKKKKLNGDKAVVKRSFVERYKRIAESEWFKKAYHNKSLGDFQNCA